MAGITDSAFREICRKHGADVVYSEMASVSALFYKPQKTLELVKFNKVERPYVVQLFGKDPAHFAKATKIISDPSLALPLVKRRGQIPDGIDINFGCPAKKVFGHGSGCVLMMQKKLAREIISAVCENTKLPVSIKIRAGVGDPKAGLLKNSQSPALGISALDFIKNTADLPYSAIMIHGRTYEGGFSGPVDFKIVEKIKKMFPQKIVLANGGINSAEEAVKILQDYPLLDGLGIARGAWGRPWIFEEIKTPLPSSPILGRGDGGEGEGCKKFDFPHIKKIMLLHAKLIHENKGARGLFEIRKHMSWYVKGFPRASELRRKLVMANSLKEIKEILS